jgi:hypothetical protein
MKKRWQEPQRESSFRYIHVVCEAGISKLAVLLPRDFRVGPLGGKRLKTAKAWIRRFADANSGTINESDTCLTITFSDPLNERELTKLDQRISASLDVAVSSKTLQAVLGITKVEQARWLSDGRLKAFARQTVGVGSHGFSVPVFDPEVVSDLERNPEIIAEWRRADASVVAEEFPS